MIERDFDPVFTAAMALREKQVQQAYRPVVAVHKWFARRPGSLFRSLLLAEFARGPLAEAYFQSHDLTGVRVGDPFAGGGTPAVEANRTGCDVVACDLNPVPWWILRETLSDLDREAWRAAAERVRGHLADSIGDLYLTTCTRCGGEAPVKCFLWVATVPCASCGARIDLFPGYVIARDRRHPRHVLVCASCGALREVEDPAEPGACGTCGSVLRRDGPARRGRCACPACGAENRYPAGDRPGELRMFALEYHCPSCAPGHRGRFYRPPDPRDHERVDRAREMWRAIDAAFVPDDAIPAGDETSRLLRWGYRRWRDLFGERQLLAIEIAARAIAEEGDPRIRAALATNLSDLLRYQNMLCRYDTASLKCLDLFSMHGFPVGLVRCEANFIGIVDRRTGRPIGSGGWANVIAKYDAARSYCERPFEVRVGDDGKKRTVFPEDEWIGRRRPDGRERRVEILRADAAAVDLPPASLDAVLTDPPYLGNVQYAELADFFHVWLRRVVGKDFPEVFATPTARDPAELTASATAGRGIEHFAEGLGRVFSKWAAALVPGGPFAFTYHHGDVRAYHPVVCAILDAGLACTKVFFCPAEMEASIHIAGTKSGIVDAVFVCRRREHARTETTGPADLRARVAADLAILRRAGARPGIGDARTVVCGHLVHDAVGALGGGWDRNAEVRERLARIAAWFGANGGRPEEVEALAADVSRVDGSLSMW